MSKLSDRNRRDREAREKARAAAVGDRRSSLAEELRAWIALQVRMDNIGNNADHVLRRAADALEKKDFALRICIGALAEEDAARLADDRRHGMRLQGARAALEER